jgi:hypothetical protein
MGMRGKWANPHHLSRKQPVPKVPSRIAIGAECRQSFVSVRNDAHFCSDRCRQRNCRRRNAAVTVAGHG